ncbi:transketolase C-terminal domain-containing protein, partial [Mycoplasmopsis bovis]|uniref:transketolase C-terminal domain-containing protein n=1 Tax=Mycoplasmopsis bovis TaxID=28903 RepID=UPI003D2DE5C5
AEYYTIEIGKANVVVPGEDLTITAYGHVLHETLGALKLLQEKGKDYSIEVIDLRTLKPLDKETIVSSVKKTLFVNNCNNFWVNWKCFNSFRNC